MNSWIAAAPIIAAYEAVPQATSSTRFAVLTAFQTGSSSGTWIRPGAQDPARQRLPQRLGLLVDLLEHEVLVAALLGGLDGPLDRLRDALHRPPVDVGDDHAARPQVGDVALLEEDDAPGVREDRRDVGGEERLALPEPDDEGHVLPRPDQPVVLVAMHDREGVGAVELAQRRPRRLRDVALVGLLDQVRDRLGVRLGDERVAARLEPVAELLEVLDDPVVDDRDPPGAVHLGMGVDVARPAVRRPARVREPDRGVRGPLGDRGAQVAQLAGALLDEEVALLVDERDARGVIAAVFEPAEALHEDRAGLTGPGIADDSTHVSLDLP